MAVSWQMQTHKRYWRALGSQTRCGWQMLCCLRGSVAQCATEGVVLGGGAAPWDSCLFPCLQVQHYVEKPSTFVSEIINCGIYLFTPAIFQHIGEVFQRNQQELAL